MAGTTQNRRYVTVSENTEAAVAISGGTDGGTGVERVQPAIIRVDVPSATSVIAEPIRGIEISECGPCDIITRRLRIVLCRRHEAAHDATSRARDGGHSEWVKNAGQYQGTWSRMTVWQPAYGRTAGFQRRNASEAIAKGLTFRPLAVTAQDTPDWHEARSPEEQAATLEGRINGIPVKREAEVLAAWKEELAKRGK